MSGEKHDEDPMNKEEPEKKGLSFEEKYNLSFLVLAYASVVSITTLVVGTSAVVVLSVGGSTRLAPVALAMFFSGSAFISLITAPMFHWGGRKVGFLIGILIGIVGAGIGALGIWQSSPALILVSSFPLGAANGIGMYLRFAAVEVVPPTAKAFAVTLVLSGGCIAAFAGPESAQATRDIFGDDLTYLGVFMMITIFNCLNAIFVSAVQYPKPATTTPAKDTGDAAANNDKPVVTLMSLFMRRQFWTAAVVAGLSWAIMALPMSIVRVAMGQLGYTSRQSLLVVEFHFLGMFSPGFITGKLIQRFGAVRVMLLAVVINILATSISLVATEDSNTLAAWFASLILIGIGWNLGFSSATVHLTQAYAHAPEFKSKVQAANDFVMFLLSGSFIFSTGYIYEAGGSELSGWRTVNYSVFALIGSMALIVLADMTLSHREKEATNFSAGKEQGDKQVEEHFDEPTDSGEQIA